MTRYYTGVGSRRTPQGIRDTMTKIALAMRHRGFILRSGGAEGADRAFETGAASEAHVYLAWPQRTRWERVAPRRTDVGIEAYIMAAGIHPKWLALSEGARKLHARNCYPVLGDDLASPSEFLVCWTPDGCLGPSTRTRYTGGTATAIVLAALWGVRVFNLQREGALDALRDHVSAL